MGHPLTAIIEADTKLLAIPEEHRTSGWYEIHDYNMRQIQMWAVGERVTVANVLPRLLDRERLLAADKEGED